jgi:hypothetical protein
MLKNIGIKKVIFLTFVIVSILACKAAKKVPRLEKMIVQGDGIS